MTTETGSAPTTAPREQGWGRVLIALALVLSLGTPFGLVVTAPYRQPVLLLVSVLAGLMLAAWRQGGPALPAAAWTGLVVWTLARTPGITGGVEALEAAFALLVGAAFGVTTFLRPAGHAFGRALAAVTSAGGVLVLLVALVGPGLARATGLMRARIDADASALASGILLLAKSLDGPGAPPPTAETEQARAALRAAVDAMQATLPDPVATILPAALLLQGLVTALVGWALFHRLSRTRVGPPLGRLADFRFPDVFVWGLIAGIALLVIPGLAEMRGVAANLLVFFGILYAARGVAVLWFFTTPGPVTAGFAVVLGLVFWITVAPTAMCLGLSDTWIDWRRRVTAPAP